MFARNSTQCVPCRACSGSTFAVANSCSGSADTTCQPFTPCATGSYVSTPGSPTQDQACTKCSDCSPGTYIDDSCLPDRDTVCGACNGVTEFSASSNQAQCSPVRPCSAGTYLTRQASTSSDSVCTPCQPGFSDTDSDPLTPCTPCADGTYAAQGSFGPCQACPAGTSDLDSDPSTQCQPCGDEEYQDSTGRTECKKMLSCGLGLETAVPGTVTSNRICRFCTLEVDFKDTLDTNDVCKTTTECPEDSIATVAATRSSDRVCSATYRIVFFFKPSAHAVVSNNPDGVILALKESLATYLAGSAKVVSSFDSLSNTISLLVLSPNIVTVITGLLQRRLVVFSYRETVLTPAPTLAASLQDDKEASANNTPLIAAVAVVVGVLFIIVVVGVVIYRRRKAKARSTGTTREVVTFENPMYEQGANAAISNEPAEGLYSEQFGFREEPAMEGGYLDVKPAEEAAEDQGYIDVHGTGRQ